MNLSHLRTLATLASILLMLIIAVPAQAAPGVVGDRGEQTPLNLEEEKAPRAEEASGGGGGLVRTFVGLAIVIAVIYGVYWLLRQVKSGREEQASGQGLASVATLPLGPGRSLHLVRAGGEVVLLGVTDQGVTPIRTYPEQAARTAGLLADDADAEADGRNGPVPASPSAGGALLKALDELRRRTVRR